MAQASIQKNRIQNHCQVGGVGQPSEKRSDLLNDFSRNASTEMSLAAGRAAIGSLITVFCCSFTRVYRFETHDYLDAILAYK
jgi:hypothetical protein